MDQYRASIRDMHEEEAVAILKDEDDPLFPNLMVCAPSSVFWSSSLITSCPFIPVETAVQGTV